MALSWRPDLCGVLFCLTLPESGGSVTTLRLFFDFCEISESQICLL